MKKALFCSLILAFAFALPIFAAPVSTIESGIDVWWTPGDGTTFINFANRPIPKGFFCPRSGAFTGKIILRGSPLATGRPGELGLADTIVQRLDDAVFNRKGVATTRVQVRSLNFESLAPLKTACGDFVARLSLDGEQPITSMRITRENAKGGHFVAAISVNIKISFTPVGRPATEPLEVRQEIRFPPVLRQRWVSLGAQSNSKALGFVLVDTDGDRTPDTYVPGTSNFGVGIMSSPFRTKECGCHEHDGAHCFEC